MQTMRLHPSRTTKPRRQRGARRLHVVPDPAPRPEPVHSAERRYRAASRPDDRAVFTCGCGYLFEARVTTTMPCPHCGEMQAW